MTSWRLEPEMTSSWLCPCSRVHCGLLCDVEPPRLVAVEPSESQVILERGQHITLRCNVTGFPEPKVTWTRKVSRQIGSRDRLERSTRVLWTWVTSRLSRATRPDWRALQGRDLPGSRPDHVGGHLHFAHVGVKHTGTYVCSAVNLLGKVEHSFDLAVSGEWEWTGWRVGSFTWP